MTTPSERMRPPGTDLRDVRHWGGFLVSGGIAFTVDAAVLETGVRLLALDARLARIAAISVAMVAGWLAHRRLTFALVTPPTLNEFVSYAAAAWISAAINWGLFVAALTIAPDLPRLAALAGASGLAMVFAYLAMRYGVFRGRV